MFGMNFNSCHKKEESKDEIAHLKRSDWAADVKSAINDFFDLYSNAPDAYVVFDFDNTSSIFDVEEQLMVYQLQIMGFAMSPDELKLAVSSGLEDFMGELTPWVTDVYNAYKFLYDEYGPFVPAGLPSERQSVVQADPMWREFASKMACMYDKVDECAGSEVAYSWVLAWFSGMTEKEVYDIAYRSHKKFAALPTSKEVIEGPQEVASSVGAVSYEYISGVQVTENIKELWKDLSQNGFDVWVCSASGIQQILAAVDAFGLHDYCTGVIGMTMKLDDAGKYLPEYNYDGTAFVSHVNSWGRDNAPTMAKTLAAGKVTAIDNVLRPKYGGKGPLAGFMDSSGDFNFCTEYSSLKMVVCFNRANRKVTDGGGLVAEVAMYERDVLGYDLKSANAAGETLYLLQGRDENGIRTFRPSNATIRYGNAAEQLFANDDNYAQLEYMKQSEMSVKEAFDKFALKTAVGELGFAYGFLDSYSGYHSR